MKGYRNILIIQTAFIGDAILASSLAEKLHLRFPDANISMLVRKGNEGIYENHPFLKETLVWNKKKGKIRSLFKLTRKVRRRKFDCVINCHRYLSSGIVASLSGARHIAGYKENPLSFLFNRTARHVIGDGRHEVQRYQELVDDLVSGVPERPRLYPSKSDLEKVKPLKTGGYVCMAPASVWFTKQLPEEKWIELCNRIPENTEIFLLGAGTDKALCDRIAEQSLHKRITVLAGRLNLLESCALIQDASMNYVNDSAPLHLATAVNAPVTAFFCSTVPAFGFGPLSDRSRILQVENLNCRPCGIHGYKACPLKHFKCGHLMPLA